MTNADGDQNGSPNSGKGVVPVSVLGAVPIPAYSKPFPDISKIEVFGGQNFRRWQERISSTLYMHGVADALTNPEPDSSATEKQKQNWAHANKVCRHTIISTLSNELFDVYCSYKKAKEIWESMIQKYTAESVGRRNFIIDNHCNWKMTEDKDMRSQINEYHKLIENLKSENIKLPDEYAAGAQVNKLPDSWNDYKQLVEA